MIEENSRENYIERILPVWIDGKGRIVHIELHSLQLMTHFKE